MLLRKLLTQARYYSIKSPAPAPGTTRNTFSRMWENAFSKHLLFTNTWTSGVLMVAGDIIEQEIEYQRNLQPERYDWARTGRMFIAGLGFGPLHHYFYGWMDKVLPLRSMKSITKKILLDQVIMSPVCIVFLFYSMGTLEGKSVGGSTKELKEKFVDVYTVDWLIWPPTQFVNFYYLPVKFQVLYINAVTMVYNIFLSFIKHRDSVSEVEPKANLKLL